MKKRSQALKNLTQRAKAIVNDQWYDVLCDNRQYNTLNDQKIIAPKLCVTYPEFYSKLSWNKNNRIPKHSKKMGDSIVSLGHVNRQAVVVKLDNEYYIADGQNMVKWLMSQNMPIEFLLVEVKTNQQVIEIMRKMNSSSRQWTIEQYINVNVTDNPKEAVNNPYNKMKKYLDDYYDANGITPRVLAALMFDSSYFDEGGSCKAIKEGTFVQGVSDTKVTKILKAFNRFYEETKMSKTPYLNAGLSILIYNKEKTYFDNEKRFLLEVAKYVKRHKLTSIRYGNKKDTITLLERCWNNM